MWTWEWITAEEAERLANDGDPILEPVFLSSLFLSSCMYIIIKLIRKFSIIALYQGVSLPTTAGEAGKSDLDHRTLWPRYILISSPLAQYITRSSEMNEVMWLR